jgi:epoxyqueuosine reductase
MQMSQINSIDLDKLAQNIKVWAKALGFQHVGICDVDLSQHREHLQAWLDKQYYGDMQYFPERGMLRCDPAQLVPGSIRIISVSMDYLPPDASFAQHLSDPTKGYVSRYALGRDYHKLVRKRLKQLGDKINTYCAQNADNADGSSNTDTQFRPFVDSAPILEHAVAEKAGIGFTGKHSLTINPQTGSWSFLGELLINLPLPIDTPIPDNCGTCTACKSICPTGAIVSDYVVDARKCISYLTIEHQGAIPEQFRAPMGNRIYGCDDCQLVCPYNREAPITQESDFFAREPLLGNSLVNLFSWDEARFLRQTEGSAIRRIGYVKWQRNISVALGNAPSDAEVKLALTTKSKYLHILKESLDQPSTQEQIDLLESVSTTYGFAQIPSLTDVIMLIEHLSWALVAHGQSTSTRQQARLVRSIKKGLVRDA